MLQSPLDRIDWPVTTERLVLRRETPEDLAAIWAYRGRPEVSHWLGTRPPTFEAFRERYLDPSRAASKLVVLHDGALIGDLMIRIGDAWAQAEAADRAAGVEAELGWVFDPAFHGRGLATEAVRAAIGLCFGPLGLRRVTADCFAENEASWRLMERLGMRREAHEVRSSLHTTEGWLDGLRYALLAEEWPVSR